MKDFEKFEIDAEIGRAWSLPARYYTDPDVFGLEQGRIFRRSWQVVGHRNQLAKPGDYFTTELAGEPLLLVRGAGGELRGFYNVCRHRAGPPAEGCGSRKLFRCGYHGWTYDLEGKLISAPEFEGLQEFDREHFSLAPVRVEEWLGFVFVNLDINAPALIGTLGELSKQAAKFSFDGLKLFERQVDDMKCNWKTYVDNYLEGYHLPSVHPGLNRELDHNEYVVEPHLSCDDDGVERGRGYVRQFSPIRGAQGGDATPRRYQEAREGLTTDYFWIFPNWMLNCYPDNISLNIVVPTGPGSSLAIFEWYLPEKELNSAAARASVDFSMQIQKEDVAICETVQKNLHSRSYERGRYSVKQETGVHAFHRMYAGVMGG